jgi:hypothetical protein
MTNSRYRARVNSVPEHGGTGYLLVVEGDHSLSEIIEHLTAMLGASQGVEAQELRALGLRFTVSRMTLGHGEFDDCVSVVGGMSFYDSDIHHVARLLQGFLDAMPQDSDCKPRPF